MEGQTYQNDKNQINFAQSKPQTQTQNVITETQPKNQEQKGPIDNEEKQEKQQPQKNKKINKKKKKQEEIVYKNLNPFKQHQKHFKFYQDRQTDFSLLFDIQTASKLSIDEYTVYNLPTPQEGTYIIKGFNSVETVNQIGYLGLNEFWKRPYRTNLNSRNQLYDNKEEGKKEQGKQQQKIEELKEKAKVQINENDQTQEEFRKQIEQKGYCFNDKIRWANVGHQYDWTLRKYPEYHTPMHPAIKQLTDRANAIYNKIQNINREYYPESAIVNYYGVKDYMTGHLDDAEYDQVSPIYSFSFGLSCVFLMGSINKDVKPLAIRLDSGDLMSKFVLYHLVMAKNSRKCYHGVPRIISGTYKGQQPKFNEKEVPANYNSPAQVEKYFSNHRININIRQVFPEHNNN